MNQLHAVIKSIETEDNISLVIVEAAGLHFSTLVIDTPSTASYLEQGNEVIMVFKETAMSVAKNVTGGLSIRNRFPSVVTALKSGKVLTAILLDCKGNQLTAVITTRAANDLGIVIGDSLEGLVKTNNISLMQKE
jgi:molybdate transport system regulatory protein